MRRAVVSSLICLPLATACGGRIVDPAPPDAARPEAPAERDAATSPTETDPTVALPPCEKGFPRGGAQGRTCDYLADGLCYTNKLDACACICPDRPGTQCTSPFFRGPNGATPVACK